MSTNTLVPVETGQTIIKNFWNDIHSALQEDFVGRNTSGAPTSGKRLGTPAIPWGSAYIGGLFVNGSEVDFSALVSARYAINSGRTRTTSNQPQFIDPAGVGNGLSLTIQATTTDLEIVVAGTGVSITSDIVKAGLTAAPGANNTALVNMAEAADQEASRTYGEELDTIQSIFIDTVGTEISGKVGEWAAFGINNGVDTEYFLAFIKSATELTHCKRGYFYDEGGSPVNRIKFANNDTITLLQLGWGFIDSNGSTIDVVYNAPIYSANEPTSPAVDDYWFDFVNDTWKKYNGVSFVTVSRQFLGWIVNDDTDAIAARSYDFSYSWDSYNEVDVEKDSASSIIGKVEGHTINVAGTLFTYLTNQPKWDMAVNLAGSADLYDSSEQASRFYYGYISDEGEEIISDVSPYFRPDLKGFYHPHNPWRCVGVWFNDSSSDIDGSVVHSNRYKPRIDVREYGYTLQMQVYS